MTKRKHAEIWEEFIMRTITLIVLSTMMVAVLIVEKGNREIEALEKKLEIGKISIYPDRIPVHESMRQYVNSLPLPQEATEEAVEEISETTETVKEETEISLEEEAEKLAKLMHAEVGVLRCTLSPEDAKRAHMLTGSVVLNRLNMQYMGATTLEEVIHTPKQYDCVEKLEQKVPEETIQWARELLENGPIGPSDMIYQAEFEQGEDTYDQIGNQYFCTISKIQ